jgi:hypothetical protein
MIPIYYPVLNYARAIYPNQIFYKFVNAGGVINP